MAVELKQVPNLRLFQNEMALGLPGDAADTLHNFILCRLPKPETALADAARHHFAKPGKMLRAKMALRAAKILKIDMPRRCIGLLLSKFYTMPRSFTMIFVMAINCGVGACRFGPSMDAMSL